MKVIVSHDVDHLTVSEHLLKDLIVPKQLIRNHLELFQKTTSFKEYILRWKTLFKNKMQNIEELVAFDRENNIPSTFFFGMDNGLGLNYDAQEAKKWINYVEDSGLATGVHGINYLNYELMKKEYEKFKSITKQDSFGIRMHYLRYDQQMHRKLADLGYAFDATSFEDRAPYSKDSLFCFPTHIMDTYDVYAGNRWQKLTLEEIKVHTKKKVDELLKLDIKFLSLLSHDAYFSKSSSIFFEWYVWVIQYLKECGCEFVNYQQAIDELNKEKDG